MMLRVKALSLIRVATKAEATGGLQSDHEYHELEANVAG